MKVHSKIIVKFFKTIPFMNEICIEIQLTVACKNVDRDYQKSNDEHRGFMHFD